MPTTHAVEVGLIRVEKAIEALYLKVEELAELTEPDAVHTDAYWMHWGPDPPRRGHRGRHRACGCPDPGRLRLLGIVEELRPFIIAEDSSPSASKP